MKLFSGVVKLFGNLRGRAPAPQEAFLPSPVLRAAADVPIPPPSNAKAKTVTLPSFLTTADPSKDSFLPQTDLRLANLDTETIRTTTTTAATLRKFNKASPDLSAATFSSTRLAVSSKYTVLARNLDGTLNEEGTRLVQQLCRRFDLIGPMEGGYNDFPSLRSLSESIGAEFILLGAGALEVVLGKSRLPEGLRPITVEGLKWKYTGKKKVPYQVIGGQETSLDVATFFYCSLDQDLTSPYAESPVQAALQPILASQAFMNDLRRVFRRAVHPRIIATIAEEIWRKSIPPDVLNDPDKLKQHMDATVTAIQSLLNGLQPEDALVKFDAITLEQLTGGTNSLPDEYKIYHQITNGKMASGAKSTPVVLGHDSAGSTNIASTQSMLSVKIAEGGVQLKLNELLSRALTLCIRLFGVDAVAEFKYDSIDLRPDSELEAYRAMKQSRVYEQLSLGQITDQEASLMATGTLLPMGAPVLTGTMFKNGAKAASDIVATPESNTSALNQTLTAPTPKEKKS